MAWPTNNQNSRRSHLLSVSLGIVNVADYCELAQQISCADALISAPSRSPATPALANWFRSSFLPECELELPRQLYVEQSAAVDAHGAAANFEASGSPGTARHRPLSQSRECG